MSNLFQCYYCFKIKDELEGNQRVCYNCSEYHRKALILFYAYKRIDNEKGFKNDLTVDFIKELIQKECFYCQDNNKLGLDRIDNSIGHLQSNCVPSCFMCNRVRWDTFSIDEMKQLGEVIRTIKQNRKDSVGV